MGYVNNPCYRSNRHRSNPHRDGVTGRDPGPFAGYSKGSYHEPGTIAAYSGGSYYDPQLEGLFSAIGGALKSAGGFIVRKAAPIAIGAIPVVGGAASRAYQGLVSPTTGQTTAGTGGTIGYRTPVGITPETTQARMTISERIRAAGRAALARAAEDERVRAEAVRLTAKYAPPTLLAAAAAEQARGAPAIAKAGVILPVLGLAAVFLLRRR